MRNHETVVAWIHLALSMTLGGAIIFIWYAAAQLASLFSWSFIPGLIAMFGKPFAVALLVIVLIDAVGAVGLLRRQAWARPVLIGISVIELPIFPLGTAVGAYTLWTMTYRSRATLLNQPLL